MWTVCTKSGLEVGCLMNCEAKHCYIMWLEKRVKPPDVRLPTASFFGEARFCAAPFTSRRVKNAIFMRFPFCRYDLKLGEAGFGKCSNAEVAIRVKLTVVRTHFSVLFPVKCRNRWMYWATLRSILTHWGRVTQICVFTLQLCKTDDANLRF